MPFLLHHHSDLLELRPCTNRTQTTYLPHIMDILLLLPSASPLTFAVFPIAKVLVMSGMGYLLATDRVGLLTASATKTLSKLVFLVFLPSLIFTELGSAITLQKMLQWWFIPVNIIISSITGCLVGCVVVLIARPPSEFINFTIIAVGIGNIGNIPLVLVDAICSDSSSPFGDPYACREQGVAYIAFGQWVGAIIVYTFVYYMLSPAKNSESVITYPDIEGDVTLDLSRPFLGDGTHAEVTSSFERKVAESCKCLKAVRWKQIFQPPVSASVLALIVGGTPFLKSLLLTKDAPLYFVTNSFSILGQAMVPCIMLVLGGNLVGGPGSSKLGLRTTVSITITRLIVIPAIGICVVISAKKFGFLPESDKLFEFVLLLQHSMPTSILAGGVAAMRGVAGKEAAAILFWEHILSVITIGGWLIVYLNLLF